MRFLAKSILPIFILFLFSSTCLASTGLIGNFIDEGVSPLARGGLKSLARGSESLDFSAPLFLDSQGKFRFETAFEYERTLRVYNGSWSGSHAYADSLQTAIAAPYSLWDGKIAGSVALGYGNEAYDIKAESAKEQTSVLSKESLQSKKGGLFLNAFDMLHLGVSVLDTDYRNRPEIPLEVEIVPIESLTFGYKRSYHNVFGNFMVTLSGNNGAVPIRFREDVEELYVATGYKGVISARYAGEVGKPGNHRVDARVALPGPFYLAGDYARRTLRFDQDFSVAEKDGGYLKGNIAWSTFRAGIGVELPRWTLEANYRRLEFNSSGGGIANSLAVVSFWPSLLVGNYNHLYQMNLKSDQYHVGIEYKGDSFSAGLGGQYLDLRPDAAMNYWRSLIFGLGNADAGNVTLKTDRIQLLFLTFGLGYHWEHVAINYAFGQFVPLATHESNTTPLSQSGAGGTGGGTSGDDLMSSLVDKIRHNPGGNIQRLSLTVTF